MFSCVSPPTDSWRSRTFYLARFLFTWPTECDWICHKPFLPLQIKMKDPPVNCWYFHVPTEVPGCRLFSCICQGCEARQCLVSVSHLNALCTVCSKISLTYLPFLVLDECEHLLPWHFPVHLASHSTRQERFPRFRGKPDTEVTYSRIYRDRIFRTRCLT
jgi:hypothetical protein